MAFVAMRFTIIVISFCTSNTIWAQVNRYTRITPSPYQPTVAPYTRQNHDLLYQLAKEVQDRKDSNVEYRDGLVRWIYDLKRQTTDEEFQRLLDGYLKKLNGLTDEHFANSGCRKHLSDINNAIEKAIWEVEERDRNKEAPSDMQNKANGLYASGQFRAAISELNEVISNQPQYVEAYLLRAKCHYRLNALSLALDDLNIYLITNKNNPNAYELRGWINMARSQYNHALLDFSNQLRAEVSADAHYNIGSARAELNDQTGAIASYSEAILLNPNFSMAYNNRGWAKFTLKQYSESLKDLNKAIELDPNNDVAWDSRCELKYTIKLYDGAIDDCTKAIQLNPELSNSFLIRGRARLTKKDFQGACADIRKCMALGNEKGNELITNCK